MGLLAEVFSNSMFGTPSVTCVCLVNVSGPFEPDEKYPAARLDSHGKGIVRVLLEPAKRPGKAGPMFGGSYVATSDSRFSEAIERLTGARFYGAVALHDRYE